ncbi:MAG: VWA domain-containing protein, partial [Kangiellaceae bacterium]|nr:VWA domain-containing protein [Kangiellaceae bacterium]
KEEIKPEALDIAVQVDGFRARVVIDGYYTNPHGRNLEGSFKIRLPDGAVPYFFAFGQTKTTVETPIQLTRDIDDSKNIESRLSPASLMNQRQEHWLAPKQAIMVSKEQAAYAYNDTVARQIDPALLEWAGAGVFSARVFPLLAKQTHRVVLGYDLDLKRVGYDLMLDLPLSNEAIEKRINLLVNSKGASAVKLNRIVNNELQTNEKISKNNELVKTSFSGKDYNGLRLTVENHGNLVLVGEDEAGGYFAKQWRVDLPQEASATKSRVVFAIDTSLSASSEKFHLWVKLINQILEQNQSEIEAFTLMSFSTQPSWWRESFVKNTSDQREKLKRYLNRLILEGATNLSAALDQAVSPRWLMDSDKQLKAEHQAKPFDLFLLSDGAVTWGERDPFFITESTRASNQKHRLLNQLFTYRFGLSGENKSLLNHLVREIGGGSYQLDHNTDMKELAIAHKMVPWKIENISLEGGKDILLAGRPNAVYPGQLLTIAGRTGEDFADSMTLSFAKGKEKVQIALPMSNRIDSELSPRTYGQIAVSQLESIAALEMKVASSFANHFRVPGKSSSLLMLESKEDYKRYKIKPEEDSYVVAHRYVSEIFSKLKAGFTKSLSSPKQRMKAQLAKLEKMKNIDFALPDAVSLLIDDLPESAFEMNRSAALVKKIDRRKVPQSYLTKLKPDSLSYDRLEKEATRRFSRYSPQDALKVLSSLIEQAPSDVAMLRDVAFASESWGLYQQAFDLHLIAANLRPFEPQSYTYLAKLAERLNRYDLALIYFEMGLASEWSNRFGDYSLIHKIDYANFLRKSVADQPPLSDQIATTKGKDSAESIEAKRSFYGRDYAKLKLKRLKGEINLEGSELIVAISWNTDRTDVDLHVLEPSGEECYYSHNKTKSGGMLTKDVTTGFGPEMYINKGAPKGKYDLLVNYFSSDRNKLGLKTKVLVRSIRHWGTDEETETTQTVVLKDQKEKQRVATVKI